MTTGADGNRAGGDGGGVHTPGQVTLVQSAVTRNTVEPAPARSSVGAAATPQGGGIAAATGVDVTNSTIAGNVVVGGSGGGIASPHVLLAFATLAGNAAATGANLAAETLGSWASVVAYPQGGADCVVALTSSAGWSYDDDGSCGFTGEGDVSAGPDPMLGALSTTPMYRMEPLPGSPLIDAIPLEACVGCVAVDQIRETRPQGGGYDTGAIEVFGGVTVNPRFTG
jgi:hypothetical protein